MRSFVGSGARRLARHGRAADDVARRRARQVGLVPGGRTRDPLALRGRALPHARHRAAGLQPLGLEPRRGLQIDVGRRQRAKLVLELYDREARLEEPTAVLALERGAQPRHAGGTAALGRVANGREKACRWGPCSPRCRCSSSYAAAASRPWSCSLSCSSRGRAARKAIAGTSTDAPPPGGGCRRYTARQSAQWSRKGV